MVAATILKYSYLLDLILLLSVTLVSEKGGVCSLGFLGISVE